MKPPAAARVVAQGVPAQPTARTPDLAPEPVYQPVEVGAETRQVRNCGPEAPAGKGREWKYPLAWAGAALGLTLGSVVALFCLTFGGSHPVAWAVAAVMLAVGTGSGVHVFRSLRRSEVLPNLAEKIGEGIYELDGVQFVPVQPPKKVRRGEFFQLELHFQNCLDQPRDVTIKLDKRSANLNLDMRTGLRDDFLHAESATGRLGPGEMARLTAPVWVYSAAMAGMAVWVRPSVAGPAGRRVRHRRAPEFEDQVGAGAQVLAILGGRLAWGGGLCLRSSLDLTDETPVGTRPSSLEGPEWAIVWSPSPEELARARGD